MNWGFTNWWKINSDDTDFLFTLFEVYVDWTEGFEEFRITLLNFELKVRWGSLYQEIEGVD